MNAARSAALYGLALVGVICGLGFAACRDLGPQNGTTNPIDSRIEIRLWEELTPSGTALVFQGNTEKEYGCANFSILYTYTLRERVVNIDFLGIYQPHICLDALGPATCTINLGALPTDTYLVRFSVAGRITEGQLTVSSELFTLRHPDTSAIVVRTPELQRVPDGTIWGLVGYITGSLEPTVLSFFDSLTVLGALPGTYSPGYYGYFIIDSSGTIREPQWQAFPHARAFIRHFRGDMLVLRDLVKRYGQRHADSLYISLYGTRGEAFYSWVLRDDP